MDGDGCASKLVLDENGEVKNEYVDADGNVKILVGPSDINPEFVYSQDLDSCKQASVVIFLDQELITDAPSITIMFMQ